MKIAIVAAGFTPAEADGLRRSMATFKFKGLVNQYEQKLIDGMMANGYTEEFAKRIFKQLEGFGSYGFPESHAASFALLVYVSCWLKCYYPDVFAAALLNSQPMGFYHPAQIVGDARKHGVEVLDVDVNFSDWDSTLELVPGKYFALRLGFREISGLRGDEMGKLINARKEPFRFVEELSDAGLSQATIEKLTGADALRSLGLDRRDGLWEVRALGDKPTGLFAGQPSESAFEPQVKLPFMSLGEHVVEDYATKGMSLKAHPVSFVREKLRLLHVTATCDLDKMKDGDMVKVAGLVLVRQRPGTAGGVCFITIEDETHFANLVVFEKLFDQYRKEILQARLLMVEGKLQREGLVTHVIVKRCFDLTKLLGALTATEKQDLPVLTLSRADERSAPYPAVNKKTQVRTASPNEIFDRGRNFK